MNVVILAAGLGKRMHSDLPKVLHPLAGKPLLAHVIATARSLKPGVICIVYGHGGERVREMIAQSDLVWAKQEPQLGTGHALLQALAHLDTKVPTLVLYGDVPLTRAETLETLCKAAGKGVALLTVELDDPQGYGRIIRRRGAVKRIVEEKDATEAERAVREINTGIMVLPTLRLKQWLTGLSNKNAQKEYYLTDVVAAAVADKVSIESAQPGAEWETLGVNSKVQLAQLERTFQRQIAATLLQDGVTLADPARIDVRGSLACGRDVAIDVNCVFEGEVALGEGVSVGANCVLRNVKVAAGTRIEPFCHLDDADIGERCRIGPYARLRPGTTLAEDVHIGSDTQLVAPVRVGRGATLGAGTTLTKDAPAGELTITRVKQVTISGWKRPLKKK